MKEFKDIKLVVVDEKPETAESIARGLRDAGQLLAVTWSNSALRLKKILEDDANIIVIANASLPWLPLDQICQISDEKQLVTIALGNISDSNLQVRALRQGAFCLSSTEHPALLEQHIKCAIELTQQQQQLAQQKQQIKELKSRATALLDTSSEPVAYTSEGVITRANPAFAQTVGARSASELSGHLISEFISQESLYLFSRNLRMLMRGESDQLEMNNTGISTLQGDTAPAMVLMHNVEVDGEHSTQIVIRNCQFTADSSEIESEAEQNLHVMDVTVSVPERHKTAAQAGSPALSLVSKQSSDEKRFQLKLKDNLQSAQIKSILARLSAWENEADNTAGTSVANSANDNLSVAPLAELLQDHRAKLCSQPLLSLHSDDSMQLARIKTGDTLMPVMQMLEEVTDQSSINWMLKELQKLAQQAPLVLGPISRQTINASSIELLQLIKANSNFILGLSEQSLSEDHHGSSQFLLQLQRLGLQASLWMNSPPAVLADLLNDLSDSVRNGIHSIVLNAENAPHISASNITENDWAKLFLLCEKYGIKTIAPRPEDKRQLQTWWRLGVNWCLAGDNATPRNLADNASNVG